MAQLMIHHDVDSPLVRRCLHENVEELEHELPEESSLTVHVKRISKRLFGADIRTRLFGRLFVVSVQDTDMFHALNRARRHLMRQVEEAKRLRSSKIRHGHGRVSFKTA